MSIDSQWPVQEAIFDRLSDDPALSALLGGQDAGIFDAVPVNRKPPYCVIGDVTSDVIDTQSASTMRLRCAIECYSAAAGYKELKAMTARVLSLLHHGDFAVSGHQLVLSRFVSSKLERSAGGKMRKSRQIFEIITDVNS